jgi:amino acid adenylation domain-containing protein
MPWQELDWRQVPAAEHAQRLEAFLEEDRGRGFELGRAPLLRLALIRLEDSVYRLVFSHHHLLLDGWSLALLFEELFAAYPALERGEPMPLPRRPAYREYIGWLRRQDLARAEAWWRQGLEGFGAPTPLPVESQRGPARESGPGKRERMLSAETTAALQTFARQHQLTLNTLVQAAWALVLSHHSGERDVVFGTTVAARPTELPGAEAILGLFINTLPVRVRMPRAEQLGTWLKGLQTYLLEMRQFEHTPLVQVQGWSEVPRGTPLFESLLIFENYPVNSVLDERANSLGVRDFQGNERTNYPLTAVAYPGQALRLKLSYEAPRYTQAGVDRLLEQWATALERLASGAPQRLGDVSLLSDAERHRLLVEWNDTRVPLPEDVCMPRRFEAQVARTPEVPAVVFEGSQLTFQELNARANQVAHHLRALGVGPEVRVGLCFERSLEVMVGLLGILKAGGAYVPLDPSYPRERLAHMLRDSAAPVLLTQRHLVDRLPAHSARVVCLDADAEAIARQPTSNPLPVGEPGNLAYIIYTSGSTGLPKGAMLSHRSALHLLEALRRHVHTDGVPKRMSVNAPLSFDASVKQLIQILDGHTLCIIPEEGRQDAGALLAWAERYRLDVLDCTPSHLRLMLEAGLSERTEGLPERVLVGGEAIDEATWATLASHPRTAFFNMYGPTECTVNTTTCPVRREPEGPTIGRPLPNVRVYVLDPAMQPVPVGVNGELYVGGRGVARGYMNRPELTAEKFVPDPFSGEPGARLYRTGDLVRYLPDGNIEYVGRIDHQVKVRGYRIELGEIESVLGSHPAVQDAAVLAREDGPAGKYLAGYFVLKPEQQVDLAELRSFLKDRLPDYMVPVALVGLPAMPLTRNGKVDRKALPAPDAQDQRAQEYVAPRTPTEELLAGVWAQVLRVERVGLHDNFFELGGHSLLATQALSRIRSAFGVELPLRALFESPTLSALALRLEEARRTGLASKLPPLQAQPRSGPMPLSFAQQRLWFLDQLEPGSPLYNIPAAVRLEGSLDVSALERAFQELVRRHESLRTTFQAQGHEPLQHIHPPALLPLTVLELEQLPSSERQAEAMRLARQEALKPFDLKHGPLLRVMLLRLEPTQHVLLVTAHHIVSDGWSTGVLIRELVALYEAFASNRAPALPELPVQYADFAAWQRGWLQGEALESQLSFWRKQLEGAPAALELPTDRPRPAVQSFRGASLPIHLPAHLSSGIHALSQRQGTTPFMALLTAFQVLLARYSGQWDVSVGSPIAGRTRSELEGLIGFFVNTLVLRSRLSPSSSFTQALALVRESTLGAFAHQDIPFERLVEAVRPERDLSRSPLFQVMFVLQNAPLPELSLPGLALRPVDLESHTSKFDLTLALRDTPQGLVGSLEYSSDLFDASTMQRMATHFQVLLESVLAHPEQSLGTLPLLTAQERQQLLVEWNDTRSDYPRESCIHTLFEAQAARTPDTVALVHGDSQLTYRQLDTRANQLAHHLRSLGVHPGTPVGLCVERSSDMVVATLAILKSGGAYVPLDPSYPHERLSFMLEDTAVPVLIAHSHLAQKLPAHQARVVLVDSLAQTLSGLPEQKLDLQLHPQQLAYVMYTSGSTGRPKGVCVPHQAVVRLVLGSHFASLGPSEVFLQLAPISFDASTFELWGSLLHGARLVLYPHSSLSLDELGQCLRQHRVSTLWLTSALFDQVQSSQPDALALVPQLLAGGDVLPLARVQQRLAQRLSLINGYGPTENTTFSTCHTLRSPLGSCLPIGRPISNSVAYVLDAHLHPVPVGVPGELYVGGDGLAWGYLHRPELTAERFLPHPFSSSPGARLYRTGDKVRWLPDGSLEFLGRLDQQVKVRGFRIELGEIESVLGSHPSLREVVVLARQDAPGDKRLVAYVVPSTPTPPSATELSAFLKRSLPDYMVPSAFVALESLPLSPNGKVDRKALPPPGASQLSTDTPYVAPRNDVEQQLAAICAELLHVEKVGINDNFFTLGGHSLLATQAVSRIRGELGVELPLRSFFEFPTVAGLAVQLVQLQADQVDMDELEQMMAELDQLPTDKASNE